MILKNYIIILLTTVIFLLGLGGGFLISEKFLFPIKKEELRKEIIAEFEKENKVPEGFTPFSKTLEPEVVELPAPESIINLSGAVRETGENFILINPDQPFAEKVFPEEVKVLIDESTIVKKIVQKTENSWGPVEATFEDIRKDDRVIIKSEENIKGKDVFTASEITVSASVEPSE